MLDKCEHAAIPIQTGLYFVDEILLGSFQKYFCNCLAIGAFFHFSWDEVVLSADSYAATDCTCLFSGNSESALLNGDVIDLAPPQPVFISPVRTLRAIFVVKTGVYL